ncbi:hypothetical protein SAMN05421743_105249 [Thalassobacillus cyri]|uniref:Uncharacterized protein n=1 Tax=Thalassobacillus cyri TaxID=571932 RepID=A0A1H4C3K6_9BACI|nr:hypothetical protein SAMN05421743_105249 [Thalassobacillus cyri]
MRDSYGIKVHGEIPQGFSPRKLTVLPWKASDFPDLQPLTTVTETVYLETESSAKGSLTVKSTRVNKKRLPLQRQSRGSAANSKEFFNFSKKAFFLIKR